MTKWCIGLLRGYMHMRSYGSICLEVPIIKQSICIPNKSNVVAIVTLWQTYSFKKQKKSSFPYPPILDHHAIKIYINQPYLEWKRLQLINLFLPTFLSIETSPNKSSNHVARIKDDKYNCWYHALDIFAFFLIIEIAKLVVDVEATAAAAQKDKRLLAEMAAKAQKELFHPTIIKLL